MSVSFDSNAKGKSRDGWPEVNWNIGNAQAMHRVLGLPGEWQMGECSIGTARQAVIRARNRGTLVPFVRSEEEVHGAPRKNEDGTVELKPLRAISFGLDESGIRYRVEQFARFVEYVAELGATVICWY